MAFCGLPFGASSIISCVMVRSKSNSSASFIFTFSYILPRYSKPSLNLESFVSTRLIISLTTFSTSAFAFLLSETLIASQYLRSALSRPVGSAGPGRSAILKYKWPKWYLSSLSGFMFVLLFDAVVPYALLSLPICRNSAILHAIVS